MKREPRTVPPARSRNTRERATGDYVDAGRHTGAVIYGDARCVEHDGRKFDDAYPDAAGGGVCVDHEIVSEQSATDDVFLDGTRAKSVCQLHQSAGADYSAE